MKTYIFITFNIFIQLFNRNKANCFSDLISDYWRSLTVAIKQSHNRNWKKVTFFPSVIITAQKWSFPLRISSVNVTKSETADLVTFTEEFLHGKLRFLCSVCLHVTSRNSQPEVLKKIVQKYLTKLSDSLRKQNCRLTQNFIQKNTPTQVFPLNFEKLFWTVNVYFCISQNIKSVYEAVTQVMSPCWC